MKLILGLGVIILAVGAFWYYGTNSSTTPDALSTGQTESERMTEAESSEATEIEKTVVTDGAYTVDTNESIINWSGKKPLIEGYTNTGSINLTEGSITVDGETATGQFVADMNTLDVGSTAKKPGEEGKLEEHLKGERWFDVEAYPTATFDITEVRKLPQSDTTFSYEIVGDLTMKGETHEVVFPATIYADAAGDLYAEAATEIDRTKWGITAGSGNFFEDLADNVIDDMIALSFNLKATKN